jgi:integral membrane protein
MNFKTLLGSLRLIGFAEGISFLMLLGTMVLKYKFKIPEPNYIIGAAHGLLFIAFIYLVFHSFLSYKWKFMELVFVVISSLIPFGTFIADAKILKPKQREIIH